MKKILLIPMMLLSLLSFAQDFVKKASENLEKGNRRGAIEMATKAIEQNPNDYEALWLRSRALLSGEPREENIIKALSDLYYLTENGVSTSKVYKMLGFAELELGKYIYRWKKGKVDTGYHDDNSAYINEQTEYYNKAIDHFKKSIIAYKRVIEISPDETEEMSYKILDSENKIQDIQEKLKQIK